MHQFLVCAYKSQDFVQSQENFARSHDRATVTFRNSENQKKEEGGNWKGEESDKGEEIAECQETQEREES